MPTVDVFNLQGEKAGSVELSEAVFGLEPHESAMHQVIVAHLAACRQGTQSALTRSEVSGGGKKPWRQKGTGRARQGSTRAPQWRHGGMVFAVKPRTYFLKVNKKVRRLAMLSALSAKVKENQMIVLEDLALQGGKTSELVKAFKALGIDGKALVVTSSVDAGVRRAAANLPGVYAAQVNTLNVYDIMNHDKFVITKDAVAKVEEVYAV
jgi:large subunit ribosomal protein L4